MRITGKYLESMTVTLNNVTKKPNTSYTKNKDVYKANIGNYHIGYYYNSVSLHQMVTDGGAVKVIYGPCSNRELYHFMVGYIRGFTDGKNSKIRKRKKSDENSN